MLELDEDIDNVNADINILHADVSDIGNDIEGASSSLILRFIYSGESKGGAREVTPISVQIPLFSCFFWQNICKTIG